MYFLQCLLVPRRLSLLSLLSQQLFSLQLRPPAERHRQSYPVDPSRDDRPAVVGGGKSCLSASFSSPNPTGSCGISADRISSLPNSFTSIPHACLCRHLAWLQNAFQPHPPSTRCNFRPISWNVRGSPPLPHPRECGAWSTSAFYPQTCCCITMAPWAVSLPMVSMEKVRGHQIPRDMPTYQKLLKVHGDHFPLSAWGGNLYHRNWIKREEEEGWRG